MLIHPWDAALDEAEWRDWLASTGRFGILAVNNLDPAGPPFALPTHFSLAGGELLVHLARPNPVWPHLERAARVRLAVVGDHAYVPGYWRAKEGDPEEHGVPTSYYATVQFVCAPDLVDDADGKAAVLAAQLADLQPEGRHAAVGVGEAPFGPMLAGIRAVRLRIIEVEAKFKYDDQKPVEHRARVAGNLRERGGPLDAGAAREQARRLGAIGTWERRRDPEGG